MKLPTTYSFTNHMYIYMCANKWVIENRNTWNYLTVCQKQLSLARLSFLQNVFTNTMYLIYINKKDLALNNFQWLICHKPQPNRIIYI